MAMSLMAWLMMLGQSCVMAMTAAAEPPAVAAGQMAMDCHGTEQMPDSRHGDDECQLPACHVLEALGQPRLDQALASAPDNYALLSPLLMVVNAVPLRPPRYRIPPDPLLFVSAVPLMVRYCTFLI